MKFKASQAVNQRIERISTNHLVVGIDIAKEVHVAAAVNFRGIQQGRVLSFPNNLDGAEQLLRWIHELQAQSGLSEVIFGAESTGHYFLNLAMYLREQGYTVVLVNPLTTRRNKENRDNKPSKNDAKDAVIIADAVSRGYYSDWRMPEPLYRKLRCLVDEQEMLSKDMASLGNQIQTALDQVFPEFTSVFRHWNQIRARATLKQFPLPDDLRGLTAEEIVQGWRAAGMTRAGGRSGLQAATELLHTARRSIGLCEVAGEMKERIGRLLQRYEALEEQSAAIGEGLEKLLAQLSPEARQPLEALCISPWLTAVLLANTGDLRAYAHGNQVLALAGLNLAECSSGKRRGQITLSKRGRRQLRKYLYLTVLGLVVNHPAFKRWHAHNVNSLRMKKNTSILKLVGKLARILVGLAHSGECFDEQRHPVHLAA